MNIGLHRRRLLALLAAFALITCTAVYSAHGIGDRAHEHAHCDLCLHLSGSAGTPVHAAAIGKPLLVVRAIPAPPQTPRPTRSPVGIHLPRGPPAGAALT